MSQHVLGVFVNPSGIQHHPLSRESQRTLGLVLYQIPNGRAHSYKPGKLGRKSQDRTASMYWLGFRDPLPYARLKTLVPVRPDNHVCTGRSSGGGRIFLSDVKLQVALRDGIAKRHTRQVHGASPATRGFADLERLFS